MHSIFYLHLRIHDSARDPIQHELFLTIYLQVAKNYDATTLSPLRESFSLFLN